MTLNLPFRAILRRRFLSCFWCLEWECWILKIDWWKFTQIHQYYTNYYGFITNSFPGMYLKLKDVRWALGVEVCLKSHLYSFCCHDYHDAQVLRRIIGRIFPPNARQPSIITAKFEVSRRKQTSKEGGGESFAPPPQKLPSIAPNKYANFLFDDHSMQVWKTRGTDISPVWEKISRF